MACRGVHFALNPAEAQSLLTANDDEALIALIQEEIEERWDEDWLCETDKAWDAIHRCLSGGTLSSDGSTLSKVILGGRKLHQGDEYIVSYLDSGDVQDVARELEAVDESWMRDRYELLAQQDYEGPMGDDDFGYTWEYLQELRSFFRTAADAKRPVIFSVSQ